ncbi:transient receptor potential cation channel subfamily A member 1-like [Tigriopus californicus]|uniref:transient receptor potential cation channel subfamily A member 1-like n=1 Tax=Tigriopus californicus TaxID=6832 RepID=UPI0027DA3F96|nr:transient receptor potential cation channel subfamily A member 1-like [Tigriopus californicus]
MMTSERYKVFSPELVDKHPLTGPHSEDTVPKELIAMIKPLRRYQKHSDSKDSGISLDLDFNKKLHFAVWPCGKFEGFLEAVNQNPEAIHCRYGFSNETLLHRACRYGNQQVFDYLLANDAVLTARNKAGATPIHLASKFKRVKFIEDLLAAGVPWDECDDQGDQPIHYAAMSGCVESVGLLVKAGAYKCSPGFRGNTIVHYAARGAKLELIEDIFAGGCTVINKVNDLTESPLHLAASSYTADPNQGLAVIKRILHYGGQLNARTIWGDTAAHYAGRWGSPTVLSFLLSEGIEVGKEVDTGHDSFFEKLELPAEMREDFKYTLLQKVAKSTCMEKAHIVLNKIMDARIKLAQNMYYSNRGVDDQQEEMNNQEKAFLFMSSELQVNGDPDGAIQMFLKYSPDSLTRLFDRCIIKPCQAQVQGRVYIDMFLFNMSKDKCGRSDELNIIENLIAMGKERFLIHPLFELFLKMKWYKTWFYYLVYILLHLIFLVSLCGFTLAHFGKLVEDMENYNYRERNFWWYFLATSHAYIVIVVMSKSLQSGGMIKKTHNSGHNTKKKFWSVVEQQLYSTFILVKEIVMPTLVGVVLYGNLSEKQMRYILACSIILACYSFMKTISRLPRVGLYVHMLNKVMATVLNFFASYVWHFLGYAIAFHILLPGSRPFGLFSDSFIKVMTMLMGEYDYTLYFVADENTSLMARAIFVVFLVDMSVVLMNLVLGLAIADIEELQRNSAVRRMMQETCAILFTENMFVIFNKICPCTDLFNTSIVNERTMLFQDVIYLDLVDLDKSPNNVLVLERVMPEKTSYYQCPHHIVVSVANIVKSTLNQRLNPDKKLDDSLDEMDKIRKTQANILETLANLTNLMGELNRRKLETP